MVLKKIELCILIELLGVFVSCCGGLYLGLADSSQFKPVITLLSVTFLLFNYIDIVLSRLLHVFEIVSIQRLLEYSSLALIVDVVVAFILCNVFSHYFFGAMYLRVVSALALSLFHNLFGFVLWQLR